MSACRSCGAPVEWVVSVVTGKRLPLDPDPVPDGNMVKVGGGRVAVVDAATEGVPRYKSHFATCPDAAEWRKPKPDHR